MNTPPISVDPTTSGGAVAQPTPARQQALERIRTPWWRRLTSLVSLGSLVVVTGMVLAAIIAAGVLLVLMVLERAAG